MPFKANYMSKARSTNNTNNLLIRQIWINCLLLGTSPRSFGSVLREEIMEKNLLSSGKSFKVGIGLGLGKDYKTIEKDRLGKDYKIIVKDS